VWRNYSKRGRWSDAVNSYRIEGKHEGLLRGKKEDLRILTAGKKEAPFEGEEGEISQASATRRTGETLMRTVTLNRRERET